MSVTSHVELPHRPRKETMEICVVLDKSARLLVDERLLFQANRVPSAKTSMQLMLAFVGSVVTSERRSELVC